MNSFNHYAYGAIGDWLYSTLAGIDIDPDEPGYKHIVLHPVPNDSLTFARATYESVYGKIESERRNEGDYVAWRAVIPPHTYAAVSLPNGASLMVQDEESGEWAVAEGEGRFESGEYAFRIALA